MGSELDGSLLADATLIDGLAGAALRLHGGGEDRLTKGAHRHPHGEFFLLQSGYLSSHTETGRWLIPAGHLCWVPPYAPHGAEMDGIQGILIHLATELCDGLPGIPCVMTGTPLILAVIDRLTAATGLRQAVDGREERLIGVLRDEMALALRTPILLPMPRDPRLRAVVERWLRTPDDRTGLDELAAEACMSRRSFTRNFRVETGLPVGEWRQIARLMHAIEMLAAGRSVTETAFSVGYDSLSSFVDLCRRHTGMSPQALARSMKPAGHAETQSSAGLG